MLAGASAGYWIAFHGIVLVLLVVDLGVLQRPRYSQSVRAAWGWTAILAALAFCFAIFLSHALGRERGLEFLSGYLVEGSLSIDNLFVFLMMFRSLGLDADQQRRVLLWGVLGAIVMRGLIIYAGTSLLVRFDWVQYIFGAFLLFASVHIVRQKSNRGGPIGPARWLFKTANESPLVASSLLLVIVAVELTDVVFALDSIPAVLAITRNPFIAYTSNIFAILGLRSLFFALSSALDRLRLLHYGLGLVLAFVALKMLLSHWIEIPVGWSLGFIMTVLAVFAIASRLTRPDSPAQRSQS